MSTTAFSINGKVRLKVRIIVTKHVQAADARQFKSIVQSLTGKDSVLDAAFNNHSDLGRKRQYGNIDGGGRGGGWNERRRKQVEEAKRQQEGFERLLPCSNDQLVPSSEELYEFLKD